jgi:hypothetical protein
MATLPATLAATLLAMGAVAQTASTAQIVGSRLNANGLKADVSFLASDALEGRGTPSRGLDLAAEYIAAQFRRAGLEPAGDDGYFQTANFATVTLNTSGNTSGLKFTLETDGATVEADKAAVTIQEGAALDVNHATIAKVAMDAAAVDALTSDQVRGKALVLLPVEAAGRPVGGNAANAVMRRLPALAAQLQPLLIVIVRSTPQPAGNPITRLREAAAIEGVTPILVVGDAAIRSTLDAKPSAEATASVHIPAPTVTPVKLRNVIGILRGSDPVLKDSYLLLTAHYDHLGIVNNNDALEDRVFNGANDDASGTASIIEIAGAVEALPERPKRSIVFMALFGEELGELGSRYYAAHPVLRLAKTIADVNLEQLGRTDDTQGPHVGMFNLTGFDYTDISTFLSKAGEETGVKAVKDEKNSDPYFTRSDNAAFAAAGVPSTTLSVAYNFPDYHKLGDEWQKLDYENLANVDRAIALAAVDIANNLSTPQWNTNNPKVEQFVKAREKSLEEAGK